MIFVVISLRRSSLDVLGANIRVITVKSHKCDIVSSAELCVVEGGSDEITLEL